MDLRADPKAFGTAMSSIAHAQTVTAAVKNYAKEMMEKQGPEEVQQQYNITEMMDEDPELQKLHEERIAQLKSEREKRSAMAQQGHGEVTEITEGEFLDAVTKSELVVCHFFHRDFERCKIMDKHLQVLAKKHFKTRFIKLSAPDAPFFTVKLNVKMLPCVVGFINGTTVGRVIGFDGLGGVDDFETENLEDQLVACGAIVPPEPVPLQDQEGRLDGPSAKVRKGFVAGDSDEDSDFD